MLSFAIPMYLQTCGNFYGHLEQQHHFFLANCPNLAAKSCSEGVSGPFFLEEILYPYFSYM